VTKIRLNLGGDHNYEDVNVDRYEIICHGGGSVVFHQLDTPYQTANATHYRWNREDMDQYEKEDDAAAQGLMGDLDLGFIRLQKRSGKTTFVFDRSGKSGVRGDDRVKWCVEKKDFVIIDRWENSKARFEHPKTPEEMETVMSSDTHGSLSVNLYRWEFVDLAEQVRKDFVSRPVGDRGMVANLIRDLKWDPKSFFQKKLPHHTDFQRDRLLKQARIYVTSHLKLMEELKEKLGEDWKEFEEEWFELFVARGYGKGSSQMHTVSPSEFVSTKFVIDLHEEEEMKDLDEKKPLKIKRVLATDRQHRRWQDLEHVRRRHY